MEVDKFMETLKLLSKLFDVSINTLLGAPRKLICQCCGMPLEDSNISKETDGLGLLRTWNLFWSVPMKKMARIQN